MKAEWLGTIEASRFIGCSIIHIHRMAERGDVKSRWSVSGTKRKVLQISSESAERIKPELGKTRRVGKRLKGRNRRNKVINRGYIQIWKPDHPAATCQGYVSEHRLVVEEMLGRYLRGKEEVHHINGNKMDNRPENLVVYKDRSEHIREAHGEVISIIQRLRKRLYADEAFKQKILEMLETTVY